jgi:hypothetical protein
MRVLIRGVSSVAAYRELLKAQRSLFRGDLAALVAARVETRKHFLDNANVGPEEAAALATDAFETAGFLRENVAQTTLNERGNYGACHLANAAAVCMHATSTNPCSVFITA